MSNYIFLTNQYLPKPGATGLCIHQLAKELASEGNTVYTVCYADGDKLEECDGVNIRKIKIPMFLNDNQSASNLKRKTQYILSLFSKLIHINQYPLRSNSLVREYEKAIEALIENQKLTIIASYTPLEAVIAAAKMKKKYPDLVRIAYYSADTLSNEQSEGGILSAEYRTASGIKWEKRLFDIFDKVFIMECHKNHYSEEYKEYINKFELVGFPLFCKTRNSTFNKSELHDKIRLVYAGTLYKVLRNPTYLLELLINVAHEIEMEVFFLGGGDCEELLQKAEEDSNGVIKYLGMQPYEIAMEYINTADVLLSIGNVESPMAPSKIFECMSTGKRIIHSYVYDRDPCINPLERYGNSLLLNQNEKINYAEVINFLKNNRVIPYEEVEKSFITSTPRYTTELIKST